MRKNTKLIMPFFVLSFFMLGLLFGCGGQEEQQAVTGEDVKEEAKEAVETAGAYAEAKKEEYQKKLDAQLEKYQQKIDALQAQGRVMTQDAKDTLNEKLETLRDKKEALQQRADELESKSGKAWEDLKAGIDESMEDLNTALEKAASHFGSSS